MSNKKIIAVVGATGAQGGSLVQPFLEGGWHVRALTRDANSEKAKALAAKGAEVVTANANNKDSLKAAFKGAYAVFAVTNFWDPEIFPNNVPKEQEQGRLMADAASESGVTYYMWSTLHNTEAISKGKWKVPHFTGKSKVDEHIKTKSNLKPIFLLPGFYATNLAGMGKVTDDTVQFTLALKPDTKLPVTDISDTGKIAFKVMQEPEKYVGKYIHVAGEYLNGGEIASIYSKVTGQKAEFVPIPLENLKQNHELYEMFGWFQEYGYYNHEDISDTKKIFPQVTTFEQFLKKSGFRITANPRR